MTRANGKAFIKPKKKNNGANNNPTKLTEQVIKDLCKYLQRGAYIETAVVLSGIGKTTFYEWIKLSHTKKRTKHAVLCRELRNAVAIAHETATMRDLENIDKCAMGREKKILYHPEGTEQYNSKSGKYEDVSGQPVYSPNGVLIYEDEGMAPSYQCSMWRLEKRKPKDWGNTINFVNERPNIQSGTEDESENKSRMVIEFIKPEVKE